MSTQWNPQSPIKLRTNATRQTDEQRYSQRRQRPTQIEDREGENPDAWREERPRSSAVRYSVSPRRETTQFGAKPTKVFKSRRFDRTTLVIWLCLALIVMVAGWWLLSWAASWWQGVQENWKYGNPRTFQADQYVNLGDSPAHPDHFIAMNLQGVIEVIQVNPQDHTKDAVYVLTNVNNESIPATLSFQNVNGDGKLDIVVTIGDSTPYTLVMLNNGKAFQPTQSAH